MLSPCQVESGTLFLVDKASATWFDMALAGALAALSGGSVLALTLDVASSEIVPPLPQSPALVVCAWVHELVAPQLAAFIGACNMLGHVQAHGFVTVRFEQSSATKVLEAFQIIACSISTTVGTALSSNEAFLPGPPVEPIPAFAPAVAPSDEASAGEASAPCANATETEQESPVKVTHLLSDVGKGANNSSAQGASSSKTDSLEIVGSARNGASSPLDVSLARKRPRPASPTSKAAACKTVESTSVLSGVPSIAVGDLVSVPVWGQRLFRVERLPPADDFCDRAAGGLSDRTRHKSSDVGKTFAHLRAVGRSGDTGTRCATDSDDDAAAGDEALAPVDSLVLASSGSYESSGGCLKNSVDTRYAPGPLVSWSRDDISGASVNVEASSCVGVSSLPSTATDAIVATETAAGTNYVATVAEVGVDSTPAMVLRHCTFG